MRPLNLTGVDLSGTHLIEAGAGTGKTYTIASLFLRLLLQAEVSVESILVVTYTVPATDELKTRIRARLIQARDALLQGTSDEPFMAWLIEEVRDGSHALSILDDALARFDEAAISTIHGFCQRVLKELAFETASPFETELVADQADMVALIADDFFRMHITASTVPEFVTFCRFRKVSPEWFMDLARQRSLAAEVIPKGGGSGEGESLEPLLSTFRQAFATLREAWPAARKDVERLVCDKSTINQNTHRITRIPGYLDEIDRYLATSSAMLPVAGCLARFTPEAIRDATKKNAKSPEHPVFDLCRALKDAGEALVAAMEDKITGLKVEFLAFLDAALARRKEKQGLVHFDDLLLRMHQALRSSGGEALADAVRSRFKAALIDEFQDTDPLQYEIFTRCFAGSSLFFIGDPKQAVYSFRGADVFTYARAAGAVEEGYKHTLIHNWRSEPGLIEAVNTVFSMAEKPFVFDWIRFKPAEPAPNADYKLLTGLDDGPMQVWFLDPGGEAWLTVEQANRAVCSALSFEISRLLNLSARGEVKLGGEPLRPSHMAVLVRTNTQARMVRDSLNEAGIPGVLYSDENVFHSLEAFEMQLLLAALAEPRREGLVRTALMTRIFGLDASAIDELNKDEEAWERWIERFRGYNDLWERLGFTPMIHRLMDNQQVRERLLGLVSGERALTNVLHISELLGRAEAADKLGMQGLKKWLAGRMATGLPGIEEYQLRLESDDDAVRVMTVHKSKGLEFPLVFCPFAWGAMKVGKGEGVMFHDEKNAAMLDLGSIELEDHRRRAMEESLAENVRLLYVALTRAKNRCYVAWGRVRGALDSAMASLMKDMHGDDLMRGLEESFSVGSCHVHVKALPRGLPEPLIRAATSPEEPGERVLQAAIDRTWGVASYTALIAGLHKGSEAADRDTLWHGVGDGGQEKADRARDIFSFPRGARSGTLLHEVFERLDFTKGESEARAVVEEILHDHGIDRVWTGAVTGMVMKVLAADLGGFCLAGLASSERLTELEFLFPLRPLIPAALEKTIKGCMSSMKAPSPLVVDGQGEGIQFPIHAPRFTFDPVKGFLRGFMDLVFRHQGKYYLVDWKSNHLGDSIEDYGEGSLLKAMVENHYILQYHLYCVALNQYLKHRMGGYSYAEHFGAVFYVFLRGVDPIKGPGYGIFRARPDEDILVRLSKELIDMEL